MKLHPVALPASHLLHSGPTYQLRHDKSKFFTTKLGKKKQKHFFTALALCTGALSCWNRGNINCCHKDGRTQFRQEGDFKWNIYSLSLFVKTSDCLVIHQIQFTLSHCDIFKQAKQCECCQFTHKWQVNHSLGDPVWLQLSFTKPLKTLFMVCFPCSDASEVEFSWQ